MYTLSFRGTTLHTNTDENGRRWIAIKHICQDIGISESTQRNKISRDPKFDCVLMNAVGADEKEREMFCIPIDQLNGWLYMINTRKVKHEAQEKLLLYQQECQQVLFLHFMPHGGTDAEIKKTLGALQVEVKDIKEELSELKENQHRLANGVEDAVTDARTRRIRKALKEVSQNNGEDGRKTAGRVRKIARTSGIYNTDNPALMERVIKHLN